MSIKGVSEDSSFADEIHNRQETVQWIQRKIKAGRSKEIASYLIREPQRFFNSLVVAIYGGDPAWHSFSNFRPIADDIDLADVPDDVEASVGFLSFTGQEKMFAIDGQHRLAGIKEAVKQKSELCEDEVSLVLVAHRTSQSGMERTRRLFTTLNKTAQPVGKGEIIALDENDTMAIVTRQFVENDPRFSGGDRIRFSQTATSPRMRLNSTTIGNLYDVLTTVFENIGGAKKSHLRFIRPPDSELTRYAKLGKEFFEGLAEQFSELQRYFEASSQRAPGIVARNRHNKGGHILFRPAGLRLFAEVTGELVRNGVTPGRAFVLLGKLPYELSSEPYRGVLWLATGKMRAGGRALCRRLLLYMLRQEKHPEMLRKRYAEVLGEDLSKVRLPVPVI